LCSLDKLHEGDPNQIFLFPKKAMTSKLSIPNITELSDALFSDFLEKTRQLTHPDLTLIINKTYILRSNSILLQCHSKFFRYLLAYESCLPSIRIMHLSIPNGNIVGFEIVLNYLLIGMLVVPADMPLQAWAELYEIADYCALFELKHIVVHAIWSKIDDFSVDAVMEFGGRENLQELTLACARLKIRNL
jgi:hypothetical protein